MFGLPALWDETAHPIRLVADTVPVCHDAVNGRPWRVAEMAATANRLEHLLHPGVLQHRDMPANRHPICPFHRQLWMFRLVIGTRTESSCW